MSEPGVYWASTWRCHDCGAETPIEPGQDTRPISDAHECDSTALAIRQTRLAAWEEGYRFALENYDDPLVRADAHDFGTGWAGYARRGSIVIEVGDEGDSDE